MCAVRCRRFPSPHLVHRPGRPRPTGASDRGGVASGRGVSSCLPWRPGRPQQWPGQPFRNSLRERPQPVLHTASTATSTPSQLAQSRPLSTQTAAPWTQAAHVPRIPLQHTFVRPFPLQPRPQTASGAPLCQMMPLTGRRWRCPLPALLRTAPQAARLHRPTALPPVPRHQTGETCSDAGQVLRRQLHRWSAIARPFLVAVASGGHVPACVATRLFSIVMCTRIKAEARL